jgi:cyclic pyranopterin phosphate synthase
MKLPSVLTSVLKSSPGLRALAKSTLVYSELVRHTVAPILPQVIQPDPTEIYVTLTANCNLRCVGCKYGRDFMPGSQLSWPVVRDLLDDCRSLGIKTVRLYGGEPLLHKDLVKIVDHSSRLGLHTWLSTNGILLKERIDDLFQAGLRRISIGYYGTGEGYDNGRTSRSSGCA